MDRSLFVRGKKLLYIYFFFFFFFNSYKGGDNKVILISYYNSQFVFLSVCVCGQPLTPLKPLEGSSRNFPGLIKVPQ